MITLAARMSLSRGKNNCALILPTETQQGGTSHSDQSSASLLLSHGTERRVLNLIGGQFVAHDLLHSFLSSRPEVDNCVRVAFFSALVASTDTLYNGKVFFNLPFFFLPKTFYGGTLEQVLTPSLRPPPQLQAEG